MKCRYYNKIFKNDANGYCVYLYHTDESGIPKEAQNQYYQGSGTVFAAFGTNLPDKEEAEVDLCGRWVKNARYGIQLSVETYTEVLPQTEEGIQSYLASGMIKGIGPRTAELIVQRFGTRTFDILENYPDSLLEIRGITQRKLDGILRSYQESHVLRDLAAALTPFNISPKKIEKIYREFGRDSLETVKNSPFSLCAIHGFGFLTVDGIARANQNSPDDPMRIAGCIQYCMDQEMQEGNLYQEMQIFMDKVYEQLNHDYTEAVVDRKGISAELYRMVKDKEFYFEKNAFYSEKAYRYEQGGAKALAALLAQGQPALADLDCLLEEAQQELGIRLSGKQAEAVTKAFANRISIITGGPGTGKTMTEKVLLYIHNKLDGGTVILVAPTGRASRRMAESTGFEDAFTMHSAMGLMNDEIPEDTVEMLDADFIMADEFSMVDMRLGYEFFSRIRPGTRLVLIGDINQLPSVGPGSVFRELIQCKVIPVTVLDMVFRQEENGRIAMNAHRMLQNNAAMDYGSDFMFYKAASAKEAADIVERLYLELTGRLGTEKVQVLTPYRKSGDASVNFLNDRLWNLANPKDSGKAEIRAGNRVFREGDKVLHIRNKNGISNGDTGFVAGIYLNEDNVEVARFEFSNERSVEYSGEELDMVEHAYALTVHKSQGSEYPVVILPWIPMFYKMLRRDIFYTAVTRAAEQVIIVGNKQSVYKAVHNTESDRRNTMLGERIIREYNRLMEERNTAVIQVPHILGNQEGYEQLAINF